jgi:hypothetical protein
MDLYLRANDMPRNGRSDDAMKLELTVRDHMIRERRRRHPDAKASEDRAD